jgi:hypothetical protein
MTEETKRENVTEKTIRPHAAGKDRQTHHDWIATYAYFLAEARGFTPERALDDWLEAERAYMEQGLAKGESD